MNQELESVRIRWFNDACYELKLPDGKGVLIDPFITDSKFRKRSVQEVEAADYILISHTHFDHVMDVGAVSRRFQSRVFAGRLSGMALARHFDLPGYQMYLCGAGDVFHMEEFTLECFRARHTKLGDFDRPSQWLETLKKEGMPEDTLEMNLAGSCEYLTYRLTLPNGCRILIWGGGAVYDAVRQAGEYRPNIAIAQLPRESTDEIAELYAAIGGQVIFPHHHDTFLEMGEEGKARIDEVVKKTKQRAPGTTVICPEKGRWYRISTRVMQLEDEN